MRKIKKGLKFNIILAAIVVTFLLASKAYSFPGENLRVPMDELELDRRVEEVMEKVRKKEAEKVEKWTKTQLAYHLHIIETDPDSANVLLAMTAIADIDLKNKGDAIGVPDNVRDIIIERINSEKEDAMRGSMIHELNRWGFHVPAFRAITYEILKDWAGQPDMAEEVLSLVIREDILDEEELIEFLELLYPILSQDANEGLIQEVTLVLSFLLKDRYGYREIASRYLTSDQDYIKRLKFLARHKKLPISKNSNEVLYRIGLNPEWDSELEVKDFVIKTLIQKQKKPEAVLTEEEMFLLAKQISDSPSPRELVSDFFKGRARLVFVSDNASLDVTRTFVRTLREALYLHSSIGLTHVALTLSPSQMINFQRFLDGEDSRGFTEILNEGLDWYYFEDQWSEIEEAKEEFREAAVQLRDAGVEFILFNAEPDLEGELVIDSQVQNLKRVFDEKPSARVLVYGYHFGWDLHNRGDIRLSSVVSLLADSLGGNDRVAVVLQDERSRWETNSMMGLHNLWKFLEEYPVESDFGLHLGETVIDDIRFDSDLASTYGEVFDGFILRIGDDEGGGGGGRLLNPTPTPLGTKKIPVPVFTPVIFPKVPNLRMTPAGGLFSL
ncbi:MAG: hypothetical protein HQ532_00595, partial [Candidatus Omnitrophica bacterium]|nr:hypothetical protein [Candidatus Omnitrophota bacterium]